MQVYHCNQPKPDDYIGYVPRLHASAMEQLGEMGIESIHDIPRDFELSEFQRRVWAAIQTDQPWFSADLKSEFECLRYPLYFMDFETINPAIPRFPERHSASPPHQPRVANRWPFKHLSEDNGTHPKVNEPSERS